MQMTELYEVLEALLRDPGLQAEKTQYSMKGFDCRKEIASGLLPQHVTILQVVYLFSLIIVKAC